MKQGVPQLYYFHKYHFLGPIIIACGLVLAVLAALAGVRTRGWRSTVALVFLSAATLVSERWMGEGFAFYRESAAERAFGTPPFRTFGALINEDADRFIDETLRREKKTLGAFFSTTLPRTFFVNEEYAGRGIEWQEWHWNPEFTPTHEPLPAPGQCFFWDESFERFVAAGVTHAGVIARLGSYVQTRCARYTPRFEAPATQSMLCALCAPDLGDPGQLEVAVQPSRPVIMRRLIEWFTLQQEALAAKSARIVDPGMLSLEQARAALAAADAAGDSEVGAPSTIGLCAHAAYLALAAVSGERAASLAAQWDAADPQVLAAAAGGREELPALRELLVERSFADLARARPDDLLPRAERARDFAGRLVELIQAPGRRLERARSLRLLRIGMATAVLFAAAAVAVDRFETERGTDLALGKPWRASSALPDCPLGPTRKCVGTTLDIFVHTQEEPSPWLEIDLEEPTTFSRIAIKNRSDCCAERAVPLVVEAGDSPAELHQLARVEEPFTEKDIDVAETRARYVRLRIDATSVLHFERVSIYRR